MGPGKISETTNQLSMALWKRNSEEKYILQLNLFVNSVNVTSPIVMSSVGHHNTDGIEQCANQHYINAFYYFIIMVLQKQIQLTRAAFHIILFCCCRVSGRNMSGIAP